jgi:hypothetical protein
MESLPKSRLKSKNLKGVESKKKGFEKIPDRIEDMSPLPSPSKKGINGEFGKRKNPFGSSE